VRQPACDGVGAEAGLFDDRQHLFPRAPADIRMLIQYPRNGSHADTRRAGNVVNRSQDFTGQALMLTQSAPCHTPWKRLQCPLISGIRVIGRFGGSSIAARLFAPAFLLGATPGRKFSGSIILRLIP